MNITQALAENAFKAIEKLLSENKRCIEKEYKSDISSYAPSIIQAGLIATVLFYQVQGDDDAHKRRRKVNNAVFDLLSYLYGGTTPKESNLYDFVKTKNSPAAKKILLSRLELALGALKLAIRFYPDCETNKS